MPTLCAAAAAMATMVTMMTTRCGAQFVAIPGQSCPLSYYFDGASRACVYCPVGTYGVLTNGVATGICSPCKVGEYGTSSLFSRAVESYPKSCRSCPSPWNESLSTGARYCAVKFGTYTVYSSKLDQVIPYPYMCGRGCYIFTADTGAPYSATDDQVAADTNFYRMIYSGRFESVYYESKESSFAPGSEGFKCFKDGGTLWKTASYAKYGSQRAGEGAYVIDAKNPGTKSYALTTVNTTYDPPELGEARRVAYGEWVQIELPGEIQLGRVSIQAGDAAKGPTTLLILGSNDGTAWSLVSEHKGLVWTSNGVKILQTETGYRWRTFKFFRFVVCATGLSSDGETEIRQLQLLTFEFRACQPGTFNTQLPDNMQASTCQPCPGGTYAEGEGTSGQCTQCPPGTWRARTTGMSLSDCTQCVPGKYSATAAATAESTCLTFPSGVYATGYGLTSSHGCTQCRPGRYGNALGCELCTPCPAGTYSGVIGLAGSGGCTKCEAGRYSGLTGATSSASCTQCSAGSYSAAVALSSSSGCVRCDAGAFSPAAGASSSAACAKCGAGTISASNGASTCAQCTAGAYTYNYGMSACDMCNAGTFNGMNGLAGCTACPAGTHAPVAGSSACTPCPPGSVTPSSGWSKCFPCAVGLHAATSGLSVCRPCPVGAYAPVAGASACTPCPPGSISPATAWSKCLACGAGVYGAFAGLSACTACGEGTYSTASGLNTSAECTQCLPGKYSLAPAQNSSAACVACAAGTYSAVPGLSSSSKCAGCSAGEYSPEGASECSKCQPGSYSAILMAIDSAQCALCDAGTYSTASGLPSSAECWHCAAGTYSTASGLETSSKCLLCVPGTYSELTGARDAGACGKTKPGTYCTGTGLRYKEECLLCEAGTYATGEGGASKEGCALCPAGEYQPLTGQEWCAPCPSGQYAADQGLSACILCRATPPLTGVFMSTGCQATRDVQWQPCSVCPTGAAVLKACTKTSDTQCAWDRCSRVTTKQPEFEGWWSAKLKCPAGQFLWAVGSNGTGVCRQCPSDMVGRNGKYCERCAGVLEEPYSLDQSLCVCKPPSVMSETGECVCPRGRYFNSLARACSPCPADTYGAQPGVCTLCGAGTFALPGATVCARCEAGKYRLRGTLGGSGCSSCNGLVNGAEGNYAPDPEAARCVKCNRSCTQVPGWREAGVCPGGGPNAAWRICAKCDWPLPANAKWAGMEQGGGCVYTCNAGFYRNGAACSPCSTAPCPAGFAWSDCSADADRGCDSECVNTSKPAFHSKWVASSDRKCPWACESGYTEVVSDYWMFQIRECVKFDSG